MGGVTHSVDIGVDVRTAYNQWTQFKEFVEGVGRVDQLDDTRLRWILKVAGADHELEAEITEQTPDQRIAWRSRSGLGQGGVVLFHPLDGDTTRVTLQMEFDPDGFTEKVGDKSGYMSARTKGDLKRFKKFVEENRVGVGRSRNPKPSSPDPQRASSEHRYDSDSGACRRCGHDFYLSELIFRRRSGVCLRCDRLLPHRTPARGIRALSAS